jgi:hypothetical protein
MATEIGQRALEEVAVRKLARQRGVAAMLIVIGVSVPLGAGIIGYLVPGGAILGLVIGPLFGLLPALVIAATVQIRALSRWKRALRSNRP